MAYSHTSRIEALIKIYSLVDCPIYSVIKHRPRQPKLAIRLSGSGLLTARSSSLLAASNPMFGANYLTPNITLASTYDQKTNLPLSQQRQFLRTRKGSPDNPNRAPRTRVPQAR